MTSVAILALLLAQATPAPSPSDLLDQKVMVNNVAATVSIPARANDFMILAQFQSQEFPVGCLSAYRDFQYELLDANGAIVPVSQQTLLHPPPEQSLYEHVIKGSTGHSCSQNAPTGVWNARAQFSALYPNLPPGKYILQITFAPRGIGQQANFAPVQIVIEPVTKIASVFAPSSTASTCPIKGVMRITSTGLDPSRPPLSKNWTPPPGPQVFSGYAEYVRVLVDVSAHGRVLGAKVVHSAYPVADARALRVARTSHYRPKMVDCKPVEGIYYLFWPIANL